MGSTVLSVTVKLFLYILSFQFKSFMMFRVLVRKQLGVADCQRISTNKWKLECVNVHCRYACQKRFSHNSEVL